MATGSLARGLALLRRLVGETDGVAVSALADDLDLPKSAVHRTLVALVDEGLVVQDSTTGRYALTLQFASMGLRHLADSSLTSLAAPRLARLADESGQLVRLGMADGSKLLWVARAQGARTGLRYDPDHGAEIPLAASASGIAWLSSMNDDQALRLVATQDVDLRHEQGGGAPGDLTEVMKRIHDARGRGWATVRDSVEQGISAMAAPVAGDRTNEPAVGVISIAGPSLLLTDALMDTLTTSLLDVTRDLSSVLPGTALV